LDKRARKSGLRKQGTIRVSVGVQLNVERGSSEEQKDHTGIYVISLLRIPV
jgi:hypothetical protein